ncbi:hypothetical protein RJ640_002630, partial [Escallonia rubra]
RGASATVYRGTLRDETTVAVKRWNSVSGRGLKAFRSEIGVLSRFCHRYVVSLIGYCDDRELALVHRMLHLIPSSLAAAAITTQSHLLPIPPPP